MLNDIQPKMKRELLLKPLFDTTSYCQSFFFFPETAIKINFHNCPFDGRTKPRSHLQKEDGYRVVAAPEWFVIFLPIGYQYTQVFLLPALRIAAPALEGWSLNLNDLEGWMQTLNLASNTCSCAIGIDVTLVGLGPSHACVNKPDRIDVSSSLDCRKWNSRWVVG